MANMKAMKSRQRPNRLGDVPKLEEASPNITAPEHAPAAPPAEATKVDGRRLRRTGRTEQLATRVTREFKKRLYDVAERDGLLLVEVLEKALDAYEESR